VPNMQRQLTQSAGQETRTKKIRILVVDDQNVVREGLATILSFQPDMEVVGQAEDGLQAIELARKTLPDVILLDLVMPRQDGLTTISKLRVVMPNARILVLTSFAESDRVYQAIKEGALGYMLKDVTRAQLLQSLRDVACGQASIHPSIAMKVIHEFDNMSESSYETESLTRRELEVLCLIARGLSNQEIASTIVVHERTIAKYVSSILNKLHVANRTQAALYAIREGIAVTMPVR
jgi:two-component system, NarL family, response regulator LiaR